ncbi:hypothetical protein TUM4438_17210 [Shewanella sairae]|uniref:Helix-hairpin-helix DNA-binding motif class 1 domain-containing protein n=1 Tax=Shewanella sairae TaxID=190310 RepID=A0ABQ4PBU6_9GAMM|nr:helix-hairpin-helix domain-containing protein [Shewanella sairae]MCL1128134.1 helix-hairpin-helix domain-containing protein [Shewanella sairae]GIU44908.1 hypothetical protein TUM4438_17210 [Shewanella sairae]
MYKVILSVLLLCVFTIYPVESIAKPVSQASEKAAQQVKLVKLNSATVEELSALHGVGEAKAAAIVEYRKVNGKFDSIEQLTEVKGIGEKFIQKNRSQLSL